MVRTGIGSKRFFDPNIRIWYTYKSGCIASDRRSKALPDSVCVNSRQTT